MRFGWLQVSGLSVTVFCTGDQYSFRLFWHETEASAQKQFYQTCSVCLTLVLSLNMLLSFLLQEMVVLPMWALPKEAASTGW